MSPTEALSVDPVASYARRRGDSVAVVLALPGTAAVAGPATLRLHNGQATLRCPATTREVDGRVLVEASVPDGRLGHRVWGLSLRAGEPAATHQLEARLLASRRQPVALLTGPLPRTVLPPPRPRAGQRRRGGAPVARARRVAVLAVDTLLKPLPEDRAARYRTALAGVARRLP